MYGLAVPTPSRFLITRNLDNALSQLRIAKQASGVAWSKQTFRPVKPNLETPKNGNIPFDLVHYAEDEKTQGLPPLVPLRQILSRINLKEDYIKLVSSEPPVVKLINYKEERLAKYERDRLAKRAARASTRKEVQLTWHAAPSDIQHKLNKALKEIRKGRRVDLAISRGSGGKVKPTPPTKNEIASYIQNVMSTLGEDAFQWKETETFANGVVVIFLESKSRKTSNSGEDQDVDD